MSKSNLILLGPNTDQKGLIEKNSKDKHISKAKIFQRVEVFTVDEILKWGGGKKILAPRWAPKSILATV